MRIEEVYYKGYGLVECEWVGVVSNETWEALGSFLEPVDKSWLDVLPDSLTVWCSGNGHCVDDVMTIGYDEYLEL